MIIHFVVFTLQTAGRYNIINQLRPSEVLFLPCKQQADTTHGKDLSTIVLLFLPCKQQADTTGCRSVCRGPSCFYLANSRQIQQQPCFFNIIMCCFYLANSRQIQPCSNLSSITSVVFTLQTAGRYNIPTITV